MKNIKLTKILAFFMAVLMILPMIPTMDLTVFAEGSDDSEAIRNELAANVGKQAIFDWWTKFLLVDDPTREDIVDIYDTDTYIKHTDGEFYWYLYEEKFDPTGTVDANGNEIFVSTDEPFIDANGIVMTIVDSYYDENNGFYWYKVDSNDLPEHIKSKPWILYTTYSDIEWGCDPYLCIYEADDVIQFVTSEKLLITYDYDENDEIKKDENGNPIILKTTTLVNYYVVSGPSTLEGANIEIDDIDSYPISALAYVETTFYTVLSKGYTVTITKADGSAWTSADGTIAIRYEAAQFGGNSYTAYNDYGVAFLYVGDTVYSTEATDIGYGFEISDVLYTNSASSTVVFEIMPEDFYMEDFKGCFKEGQAEVFDVTLANSQMSTATSFDVLYSFTQVTYKEVPVVDEKGNEVKDENGNVVMTVEIDLQVPWYWISSSNEYFFVKADDVEEYEEPTLLQDAVIVDRTGYFVKSTIRLYNTNFEIEEYIAQSNAVHVDYSFSYNGEWYFWLSGGEFDGKEHCIVEADVISFLDPSVSPLEGLLRYKVRFIPECGIVDYLYSEPGYEATALSGVMVTELPELFIIVDTYYTSEDDIYFKLEADGSDWWMADCGYDWVSADLLELVTINYTDMAPFGPPVIGQSMAVYARSLIRAREVEEVSERLQAEGVETKKTVTPTGTPGEYIVTLEAYVTGQKTTVTITEDIATDIILVLDQSGSMDTNDFETISSYNKASGKSKNFANQDVYVKEGDAYIKVAVTPIANYNYQRYSESTRNRTNWDNYNNQANLYYKVNGEYRKLEVDISSNYNTYTYYYIDASGNRKNIVSSNGWDTRLNYNTYEFYTRTGTPSEYVFSYVDSNGTTQSETFGTETNITTNKYYTATTSTITRLQALKNAVTAFAESVHEKAKGKDGKLGTDDDVNHRVAIVGFANYSNHDNYNNSEVFVGGTGYKYGSAAKGVYDKALQDMNTTDGYNNIIASKNALSADGATYVDLGIEMANGILEKNPVASGEKRNRVVIVFTDGDPGYTGKWEGGNYGSQNGNAEAVADKAIANANTAKNTYGATVYTIGVFNGADAESRPVSSLSNGNKFMHYVSNNYKNSTSFDDNDDDDATFPESGSYYLSANNSDDLTGIFQQISSNVEGGGASTTLDETTVVRDIVSPNFIVPEGATGIKYYTQAYIGENKWDDRVEAPNVRATSSESDGTTTLDVTGFDFSENYVGTETKDGQVTGYRGKKLVIEFKINVDPDFLGGSNVDTNGALSGIYTGDGNPVEYFEQPKQNIALKEISTVVKNKYIYYGNTADLTDILNLYVKRNDQQTDLRVTVDGVNNAYVNLEYTITLDDNTVAVYTILAGQKWDEGTWAYNKGNLLKNYQATEDTGFAVTCVMTDAGSDAFSKATGNATVYVYTPDLTFMDTVQDYKDPIKIGEIVYTSIEDFLNAHYKAATWSHPDQSKFPAGTWAEGTAPTFSFEFSDNTDAAFAGAVMNSTTDVPVTVVVTVHGKNIDGTEAPDIVGNDNLRFSHDACSHCGGKNYNGSHFIVHVINALTTLTIQKVGHNSADPNQTFLFNVAGADADGNPIDVTVTVHEDGSVTIAGLIIGNEYTITEDSDWSWRYQYGGVVAEQTTVTVNSTVDYGVKVTLGESNNVITLTNTRLLDKWLDGDSWLDNLFSLFGKN